MEKKRCGSVRHTFRLHRMNETELVHMPRHLREKLAHPATRLPVPREFPGRLHDPLFGGALAGIGERAGVVEAQLPAVLFLEQRLVIESIHLAGPALHEEEDDAPGARPELRRVGSPGIVPYGSGGVLVRQPRQGQITETARERSQRVASSDEI